MAAEGGSSGGVDVGVGEKGEHTHTQLGPAAAPGGADASRDATTDTASGGAGSDTRREVRDQAAEVALWHEYAADARSEDAALQLKGVTALRESLERNSETLSRFDASTARGPLGCLTRFFSEEFDHLSPLQREAALALSFGVVMMVQDDDVPKAVLGNLVRLSKSGADVELRGACVMCLARVSAAVHGAAAPRPDMCLAELLCCTRSVPLGGQHAKCGRFYCRHVYGRRDSARGTPRLRASVPARR